MTDPYPGPPPQVPPPQPQPVYVVPTQPPKSGFATASLLLGIMGLVGMCCTFGIPSALAVIFGHVGRAETRAGRLRGRENATVGLAMGYVGVIPSIVMSIMLIQRSVS